MGQATCRPCRREQPRPYGRRAGWSAERDCETCGRPFEATSAGQRFCSRACSNGQKAGVPGVSRVERTCEVCESVYTASHAQQETCGRACGVELRRRRSNLGNLGYRFGVPTGVQQELQINDCGHCGGSFLWWRGRAVCPSCPYHRPKPIVLEDRICVECNGRFEVRASTARRYCTTTCTNRAARRMRRAQSGRFTVSTMVRRAVYGRDQYMCHLCGHAVRMDVEHAHPWSATLDHLIPRSAGGGDGQENLACAHRWCNSVRGNEPVEAARVTLRDESPSEEWDTELYVLAYHLIRLASRPLVVT